MYKFIKKIYFTVIQFIPSNIYKNNNIFRILMYHDIKLNNLDKFEKQLIFLKKNDWSFIEPKNINKKKSNCKNLLITFDDGFLSNYIVAKKILNKHQIKALFLIPSKILYLKNDIESKYFVINNLKILGNQKYKIMCRDHLQDLIKDGHSIGCHTHTHPNLGLINDDKILYAEIVNSKNTLEKVLNIKIDNFAYPFGTLNDISGQSYKIISKNFKNIFTGVRGNNINTKQIFFRDEISLDYSLSKIQSILYGFCDFFYFFSKNKINYITKKY